MKRLVILLVASITLAAWAQTPAPPPAKKEKLPRAISVPDVIVPPELAQRGVQGMPVLRGMVQPDGTITDIEVVETSRSPEFDEVAKSVLRQVTFEPLVVDGIKVAAPYQNAIALIKDHVETLSTKTCADLNIDVSYFRATFPELGLKDMTVARMSLGAYTLTYKGKKTIEWVKRATGAFEKTAAACVARPGDKFFETFVKMTK